MIARLLAHPWLYGAVAAAILGAGGLAWWRVHAWRSAYQERPALVAERDAATENLVAMQESARLTGQVLGRAEDRVAETAKAAGKVRVVYREAVRTDPTCAAWAAQPIPCRLGAAP